MLRVAGSQLSWSEISQMLPKCHKPPLLSRDEWEPNVWNHWQTDVSECVTEMLAYWSGKNRDLLIVLEETEEKEV